MRQALEERETVAVATIVAARGPLQGTVGQKLLCTESDVWGALTGTSFGVAIIGSAAEAMKRQDAQLFEVDDASGSFSVFIEPYHPVARLLVLGGGYIARPLVAIASLLGYEITVVDDRPSFAVQQRFPEAKSVVCDDFIQAFKNQRIDAGTSVVIITRGHKHDLDCLMHVLQYEPGYVGMIGSRRRVKMVKEHLIASGYPEDRVNRVHMPIGLEIGGETPEEIAVSIAAQLVEARRGRSRWLVPPTSTVGDQNLLSRMFDYLDEGQPCVVATVVRTVGSTPRKAGARMLLLPDGGSVGTIGGGCGEAAVRSEAMMLFDAGGARLVRVVMDADAAADEGMACGGTMDVFLERLA